MNSMQVVLQELNLHNTFQKEIYLLPKKNKLGREPHVRLLLNVDSPANNAKTK